MANPIECHSFIGQLNKLISDNEGFNIDWDALPITFARASVEKIANQASRREGVTDDERKSINVCLQFFQENIEKLQFGADPLDQMALHHVIVNALLIGVLAGLSPETYEILQSELSKYKRGLEKGPQARTAPAIRESVENRARELWQRKRSFRENASATARQIRKLVRADIQILDEIPKGWKPCDLEDEDASKREIDRIRKIVARILLEDGQSSI